MKADDCLVYDCVQQTLSDGVLVIRINRPETRNALNGAVARGIAAALDRLDADAGILVGILTGTASVFSSGADLKGLASGDLPVVAGRGFGGIAENPPAKPLIAAVEGYAVGGGFELALACDLIVAANGARFGIPEVKRGLVASGGGLLRLPVQMPPRIAMELALTGDWIDARRAYELGLVNHVVDDGQALQTALEIARKIAANGPLAVLASKKIIRESTGWVPAEMFKEQRRHSAPIFQSEDAKEGARAFVEKRAPSWRGK
jgi:enoyl-CoA hydratase